MIPYPRSSLASRLLLLVALTAPIRAQQMTSRQIASLGDMPIGVTAPRGETHRLFVFERRGRIRIVRDGVLLAAPFLDITPDVVSLGNGGLLGLAFHPDYAANGRFFVSFTTGLRAEPCVREYHASALPDLADPASGVDVLAHLGVEWGNAHYGSDLHFGPDGMLYLSLGRGNSDLTQRLVSYSGKLLRIDVDIPPPHIPSDNPYANGQGGALPLIWARGFRNPWRFSFDRLTGDLYVGDVGATAREEIDFQPASSGAPGSPGYQGGRNYGYPCMEGTLCHSSICPCDPSGATMILPAFEWTHDGGNNTAAVIGGYVYRGSALPSMVGRYFCADYAQQKVWTFVMLNGQATDVQEATDLLGVGTPSGPHNIVAFGEDADGELYLACAAGHGGSVFRIEPASQPCAAPVIYCGTNPNSTGDETTMRWCGSTSIASNDLVLVAVQAPRRTMGAFRCGRQEIHQPFGNGWNCIGGTVLWSPYLRTDVHGEAVQQVDYSVISVGPGQTRDFQFIHRDPSAGGSGFNLSDGLRVVFCP